MFSQGFELKDVNRFVKDLDLVPGTILINPQTQEQYQVGENGELTAAQQAPMAAPNSGSSPAPNVGSMGDVMNTLPDTSVPGSNGQPQI